MVEKRVKVGIRHYTFYNKNINLFFYIHIIMYIYFFYDGLRTIDRCNLDRSSFCSVTKQNVEPLQIFEHIYAYAGVIALWWKTLYFYRLIKNT